MTDDAAQLTPTDQARVDRIAERFVGLTDAVSEWDDVPIVQNMFYELAVFIDESGGIDAPQNVFNTQIAIALARLEAKLGAIERRLDGRR